MIRDFEIKSLFYVFIVNKLKFLYFSIDINEPASLNPIVGKKIIIYSCEAEINIFNIEAEDWFLNKFYLISVL